MHLNNRLGLILGLLAAGAVLFALTPTAETSPASSKVEICHKTGNGEYNLIGVNENSVEAHRQHGDGLQGEEVPGYPTKAFADDCGLQDTVLLPPTIQSLGCGPLSVPAGTPFKCSPLLGGGPATTYYWTSTDGTACGTQTGLCYWTIPYEASSPSPYFAWMRESSVTLSLTACNSSGCASAVQLVEVTDASQCIPPKVTTLSGIAAGTAKVALSWSETSDCTQGYLVYFSDSTDVYAILSAEPSTLYNPSTESGVYNSGNNTSFVVSDLQPNKSYNFWVFSYGTGDGQNWTIPASISVVAGQ
ncbi:MAG: fibronectin type III domain-containing protein [Candidatus Korobacteraceae bacterium]